MAKKDQLYTYRNGKKLKLQKRSDQFVVRRLPDALGAAGLLDTQQMSSASARVTCKPEELEELMRSSRKLAPTHHAYEGTETGKEFLITDRLIVTFHKPLSVEDVGKFAGRYALQIVTKFSDTSYLFRLTDATGMNPIKLVVKLVESEKNLVANVDHDLNERVTKCLDVPTDPSYLDQWHLHLHAPPQHGYDERSSARCETAWMSLDSFGSAEVVIGVTDDGCQLDHPDFNSAGKFAGWGYFEGFALFRRGDAGADPDKMYQNGANHGTSCAGVIAAETDGEMTVGAAPGCRLLPIKWESDGPSLFISDSKILTMLNYVAGRVDVLSNSWGISPSSNRSQIVIDRITELAVTGGRRGTGIVFLWAAGNENCPISHIANQDVPFTNGWEDPQFSDSFWVGVTTARVFEHNLVGVPGVMYVAALASTAQRSHYSNYGTGIDICAPTSNSHEYRRLHVHGFRITTATGAGGQVTPSFGGTSSATPLVAGVAGLVISANPELSALEVIAILKQTASKDLDMTGYPKTPPSVEDPNPDWDVSPIAPFDQGDFTDQNDPNGSWSPWFGHGRVDAASAVARAQELAGDRTTEIQVQRVENLAIPDDDPAGIGSRIFIERNGSIRRLAVRVNITHTYIGDLLVRLVAPDGRGVDLHNRTGGRTDNLVTSYDESSTAALANLHGLDIRGTWSLEVSDRARIDLGQLNSWVLEATVVGDGAIRRESTPGRVIPDNDADGVTDTIAISDPRAISNISTEIDITHSWIDDLVVELTGPEGTSVRLHDRTGGDADNILRVYGTIDTPELGSFVGTPAQGTWSLKVSDHAGQDVGKLNRWALRIS